MTYMTAATCFMEFISLREGKTHWQFVSLTMDTSTDDSDCVTEQETIFIRNCVQGFVCIGEPKTTSSEDMFACVNENYLTNHKSKFVGFGCDGASNMMGCKTGLVTRLQECYPEVEDIGNDREVKIESEREIRVIGRERETLRKIGTRVM